MPVVWNHQRMALPPEALTFLKISVNVEMFGPGMSFANLTHATLTPLENAGRHTPPEFELPAEPVLVPPLPPAPATGDAPPTGALPPALPRPPVLGEPPAELPPVVADPPEFAEPPAGALPALAEGPLPPVAAAAPPAADLPPPPEASSSEPLLQATNEAAQSTSRHDETNGARR